MVRNQAYLMGGGPCALAGNSLTVCKEGSQMERRV